MEGEEAKIDVTLHCSYTEVVQGFLIKCTQHASILSASLAFVLILTSLILLVVCQLVAGSHFVTHFLVFCVLVVPLTSRVTKLDGNVDDVSQIGRREYSGVKSFT